MKLLAVIVLCLVVTGFARTAAAQDAPSKVEISGGWNYMAIKDNGDETWTHLGKGWYADVVGNLNERWAVVGQVAGAYKTLDDFGGDINVKVHPYLFGVRANFRDNPKHTPFAQFLVGATNFKFSQGSDNESSNNLTFQVGGGVNLRISGRFGARVAADYIRVQANDNVVSDPLQGLRLGVGLVLGFGD